MIRFSASFATICLLGFAGATQADFITISSTSTQQTNANLTALGANDWTVYGITNTSTTPDAQMSGGSGIGALSFTTNGNPLRELGQYGSYGESTLQWSNGSPTASASNVDSGMQVNSIAYGFANNNSVGTGWHLSVNAGSNVETLTIFTTLHYAASTFTATLQDGTGTTMTDSINVGQTSNQNEIYTVTFQANSATTLTLSDILTADNSGSNIGNDSIEAAALTVTPSSVPEPSSLVLCGLAGLIGVGAAWRRRKLASAA
jgi:hypothetical protein